jgi:hypothetical protein
VSKVIAVAPTPNATRGLKKSIISPASSAENGLAPTLTTAYIARMRPNIRSLDSSRSRVGEPI